MPTSFREHFKAAGHQVTQKAEAMEAMAGLRGGGGGGMGVSGMVFVGLVLGCIVAKFCK